MLGDCYTAAIVEELSRKELMALDAASVNYPVRDLPSKVSKTWHVTSFLQDMPAGTPNGHSHDGGLLEGQTELTMTDSVVVDMSAVMNNVNLQQEHSNRRV